jgi:hypothetical protein
MEIRHLLKSQANEVFQALTGEGFNPTDFDWQLTTGQSGQGVSRLVHKPSSFYFTFDNAPLGTFRSEYSPSQSLLVGMGNHDGWVNQRGRLNLWLKYLKREIESPDLWESISGEAKLIEAAAEANTGNSLFTEDEKKYVFSGLEEIKQYLLTAHKLDPELVESRLKYLAEASERVGKKDWINLLISTLIGIVIAAALPPETTRDLFRLAGTVLRQILSERLLLL